MGFINQYLRGPFSCRFPCQKNVIHCSELFLFIFFTLHPTRYCLLAQSRGQLTQQYLSTEPTREMVQNIPWNPPEWSASMRNYWKAIGFRGPFVDTPVNFQWNIWHLFPRRILYIFLKKYILSLALRFNARVCCSMQHFYC